MRWPCSCLHLEKCGTFLQRNLVVFLDFRQDPQWQSWLGPLCAEGASLRQPVSCEQWHAFQLYLWPCKGERDTAGTLHLRSLEESKRGVGVFLEAAARHCEIKINWQEMFAIPVPIPARRAEGTGKGGFVESPMRSAASICLLPLGGLLTTHIPNSFLICSRKLVLGTCDYPLQREGRSTFKECFKECNICLHSLRRQLRHQKRFQEEKWRRCLCRG